MLGLALSLERQRGQPILAATQAVINAATTPPAAARVVLINNLIASLQAGGVWSRLDCLWILAAADSQIALLNWINPGTNNLSNAGSITFTADKGFTSDGISTLTGPNPTSQLSLYTLNSAHMGVWCGTDATETIADFHNGGANSSIRAHSGATTALTRSNDGANATPTISPATAVGHTSWSRDSSTTNQVYKNGSNIASPNNTSTSVPNAACTVCGGAAAFSTKRIAGAHLGSSLTATQMSACYSALNTYMTAVGA